MLFLCEKLGVFFNLTIFISVSCNHWGLLVALKKSVLIIKHSLSICDPQNNWVPRRGDQGPKTLGQIHKEAKIEEQREQIKVQQQLLSKKDAGGRIWEDMGGRGSHTLGGNRTSQAQDEGLNTAPAPKNRPVDSMRLCKVTKVTSCPTVTLSECFFFWFFRCTERNNPLIEDRIK